MNQSAFEVIKANLPKSNCEKCGECRSVDEGEILYTDRSSDAYFTGVFYPPPGETVCSLMRVQAMETFYLALQLEKSGEEDRFSGVNFGAILVEDQGIYASAIHSTTLLPDEMILPPIHTLGRVHVSLSPDNPVVTEGLGGVEEKRTTGDKARIQGMAKYLRSQNIRYVSMVYTEDKGMLRNLRNYFTNNEICFASSNHLDPKSADKEAQITWVTSAISAVAPKAPYCVVATDDIDIIKDLITGYKGLNGTEPFTWVITSPVSINWSFLPKHHSVITLTPPAKYHDAIQNHFNQITGYDIAVKTWLADYYRGCSKQRTTADITEMSDSIFLYGVLMAVKKLVQFSNSVYYEACDTKGLCEQFFHHEVPFKGIVQHHGSKTVLEFEVPWDIVQYKVYGGSWRGQTVSQHSKLNLNA